MSNPQIANLRNPQEAARFYEDRFAHGYVDDWPAERKRRIAEILDSLDLPSSGVALDFGCGNGVLTETLRRALPSGWSVRGTDLSNIALGNARRRYPACSFLPAEDVQRDGAKYDLLLTHHVLEHVGDLDSTLAQLAGLAQGTATMLHILPCGNEGSFERNLCLLCDGGIDAKRGNCFFFEEEAHLRRLTTQQLTDRLAAWGFRPAGAWYANQHAGAIESITRHGQAYIRRLSDPSRGIDAPARRKLAAIRRRLLFWWALRSPARRVEAGRGWGRVACLPLYPISKPADIYLKRAAEREWRAHKSNPHGSEMFLCYRR